MMEYAHPSEGDNNRGSKGDRVEFRPPNGFSVPEGSEEKGEFDLVCSFRVKPDGMVCMTQLGDHKMPGYDGKEEETEETKTRPDYKELASSVTAGMPGTQEPAS